jgi:uncharacterized membrane protein HdeD (DUF308 family)
MSAPAQAAPDGQPLILPSTILLTGGVLALVAGIILLVIPDHTLTLLGVVAGIYLLVIGVIQLARGFAEPGLLTMERAKHATVGLVAVIAGILAILRPDSSVRLVTVVLGIFLIVLGLYGLVDRLEAEARGISVLRAALTLIAGIILLIAPDKSAKFAVILVGIYLVVFGLIQLYAGWRLRKLQV